MEQQIRFCTTADGVRIAYASVGRGPLVVRAAHWMTHLEYDWRPPANPFLETLSAHCTLVRYDERGCGLSDRDVDAISFEAMVGDLESVVDASGLDRFALLGMSQGGPVAVAYTVRHPERVTRLILHGTYARGWAKRSRAEREEHEAQIAMMKTGWDKDNPAYRQVFASLFIPDATREQVRQFNEWMRLTTSPENAARIQTAFGEIDVQDLLPKIAVPTVVFHSRRDARCPFEEGRRVAALIPNAKFIPLESNNHMPQPGEPASEQMIASIFDFLGVDRGAVDTRMAQSATSEITSAERTVLSEAATFVAGLDEVDLSRFRVVGAYTRYDEAVRNALQDARQKILAGFEPPGRKRENHLIWAAPGTGKTYFVQQVAASLAERVQYHEVNLAKCTEAEFRAGLGRLGDGQACLCLIDEADAKPQEPWPYEVLLPYLDAAVERGARFVFVLAGSSGSSLEDIKQRIAARPKGTDLLSRIPTGHEHVIGPMSLGDRLLIVLSQLRQAGQERGRDIRAIEKLGLYYVALNERLVNARQLREFAVRAVERVPKTDSRVKYDHLFLPGDPENKAFWVQAQSAANRLVDTFVILARDGVGVTPSSAPQPGGGGIGSR